MEKVRIKKASILSIIGILAAVMILQTPIQVAEAQFNDVIDGFLFSPTASGLIDFDLNVREFEYRDERYGVKFTNATIGISGNYDVVSNETVQQGDIRLSIHAELIDFSYSDAIEVGNETRLTIVTVGYVNANGVLILRWDEDGSSVTFSVMQPLWRVIQDRFV